MKYYIGAMLCNDANLQHYGIIGMKWGVRRFQNYDGSYTRAGMERYRQAMSDYKRTKTDYKRGLTDK